ncbi:hypothetical protein CDAR_111481, partial [Caerostris darwini]
RIFIETLFILIFTYPFILLLFVKLHLYTSKGIVEERNECPWKSYERLWSFDYRNVSKMEAWISEKLSSARAEKARCINVYQILEVLGCNIFIKTSMKKGLGIALILLPFIAATHWAGWSRNQDSELVVRREFSTNSPIAAKIIKKFNSVFSSKSE